MCGQPRPVTLPARVRFRSAVQGETLPLFPGPRSTAPSGAYPGRRKNRGFLPATSKPANTGAYRRNPDHDRRGECPGINPAGVSPAPGHSPNVGEGNRLNVRALDVSMCVLRSVLALTGESEVAPRL